MAIELGLSMKATPLNRPSVVPVFRHHQISYIHCVMGESGATIFVNCLLWFESTSNGGGVSGDGGGGGGSLIR